jgi:hypothetical protein
MKVTLRNLLALEGLYSESVSAHEMYRNVIENFDVLIEFLIGDHIDDETIFSLGFNKEELDRKAFALLDHLIFNRGSNSYLTLCVFDDASQDEIKHRWKELLKLFHPDRNRDSFEAEVRTKRINEAYEAIINNSEKIEKPLSITPARNVSFFSYNQRNLHVVTSSLVLGGFIFFIGFLLYFLVIRDFVSGYKLKHSFVSKENDEKKLISGNKDLLAFHKSGEESSGRGEDPLAKNEDGRTEEHHEEGGTPNIHALLESSITRKASQKSVLRKRGDTKGGAYETPEKKETWPLIYDGKGKKRSEATIASGEDKSERVSSSASDGNPVAPKELRIGKKSAELPKSKIVKEALPAVEKKPYADERNSADAMVSLTREQKRSVAKKVNGKDEEDGRIDVSQSGMSLSKTDNLRRDYLSGQGSQEGEVPGMANAKVEIDETEKKRKTASPGQEGHKKKLSEVPVPSDESKTEDASLSSSDENLVAANEHEEGKRSTEPSELETLKEILASLGERTSTDRKSESVTIRSLVAEIRDDKAEKSGELNESSKAPHVEEIIEKLQKNEEKISLKNLPLRSLDEPHNQGLQYEEVEAFIDEYVRLYEKGDIDQYLELFWHDATENGVPILELRGDYERCFDNKVNHYTLRDMTVDITGNDQAVIRGDYSIKRINYRKESVKKFKGKIEWRVEKKDNVLKIVQLIYD